MSKSDKNRNLFTIKLKKFLRNNKILLIVLLVIVLFGIFAVFNENQPIEEKIFGDDVIEMHYFYLRTCPHCIEQKKFHPVMEEMYPNLKIIPYDMAKSSSLDVFKKFAANMSDLDPESFPGTPLTIIGDEVNFGFGTPEDSGVNLLDMVAKEQKRIDSQWEEGMIRTVDLRNG